MNKRLIWSAILYTAAATSAASASDVPYVPTPEPVVEQMLRVAKVNKNDVIYDLGSGDGRIVITAAKEYGAHGVGVDIDPQRVKEANENARNANVTDKVEFKQQDLFKTDLSKATVVTLYLLPEINLRLRPKLMRELKPGTRVVSHNYDMGNWQPKQKLQVQTPSGGVHMVYFWVVPENKNTETTRVPMMRPSLEGG